MPLYWTYFFNRHIRLPGIDSLKRIIMQIFHRNVPDVNLSHLKMVLIFVMTLILNQFKITNIAEDAETLKHWIELRLQAKYFANNSITKEYWLPKYYQSITKIFWLPGRRQSRGRVFCKKLILLGSQPSNNNMNTNMIWIQMQSKCKNYVNTVKKYQLNWSF